MIRTYIDYLKNNNLITYVPFKGYLGPLRAYVGLSWVSEASLELIPFGIWPQGASGTEGEGQLRPVREATWRTKKA